MANISSTTQWSIGVVIMIITAVASYSISESKDNEGRIVAIEIEVAQVSSEVEKLRLKYNMALYGKNSFQSRLVKLEVKLENIEAKLDQLRQ